MNACFQLAPAESAGRIETLLLPQPGEGPHGCDCGAERPELQLLQGIANGTASPLGPPDPGPERAHYRWHLGHQATFQVWQWLKDRLRRVAAHGDEQSIADAALGYRAYAALLLYSGSCGREEYESGVREEMRARHPAFSGEWAPDHQGLQAHYRNAVTAAAPIDRLVEAARLAHRVHKAVADRLVPDGGSLLRDHGRHPGVRPTAHEFACYDAYFGVERARVCRSAAVAQFLRKVAQILRDLAVEGLGPLGPYRAERAGIASLAAAVPQILMAAALRFHATATEPATRWEPA